LRLGDLACPCLALSLRPTSLGFSRERPLKDATVTCTVERRGNPLSRTDRATVALARDGSAGVVGRWPDEWFDAYHVAPSLGRYRVRWTITFPDGRVERRAEKLHVDAGGAHHVGHMRSALRAATHQPPARTGRRRHAADRGDEAPD
jgi:hypothetical protein